MAKVSVMGIEETGGCHRDCQFVGYSKYVFRKGPQLSDALPTDRLIGHSRFVFI